MIIAGAGHARDVIVEPADDMNVVAKRRQRREARRHPVALPGFRRR